MSEYQFETNPQKDRSISHMNTSVNVQSVNVYQLMNECYYGNGGIRSGVYLIPFSRESDYDSRKKLAIYKNYIKPAVRAMIEPVFNEEAVRTVSNESGTAVTNLFTTFLENVDAAGTKMQDYSHATLNLCRRHGVVFTVMDNFGAESQPETVADAERLRIMPYIYNKQALDVAEVKTDKFGNLTHIIFKDEPEEVGTELQDRWRKWDSDNSYILGKSKNGKWEVLETVYHGLGKVPVIVSYSDVPEDKTCVLVDPPLYNSALINLAIYNQTAEIRDQERAQAFSIFYGQGLPEGDSVFGPKNFINLAMDVNIAPGYASPDFGIISGLVSNQEQLRKDLYMTLEQAGVVGVQNSESGIAKSYDFYGMEETLKRTSTIATIFEEAVAELFKLYTSEDFVYTVIYQTDFAPMGIDREVDRFDKIFKMPINRMFKYRVMEKLARIVLADEDREVIEELVDNIREESMEEPEEPVIQDETMMDSPDDEGSMEDPARAEGNVTV
jgi:hypothetical protein